MLPAAVRERLRAHLAEVKPQHERDLVAGVGRAVLPFALDRKYPAASTEWMWQSCFPRRGSAAIGGGAPPSRFHLHESVVQKAMAAAARAAGITKLLGPHSMRHSVATRLLEERYDIRTVQELLGHAEVSTTMVYLLHVLNRGALGVRSPLDRP